MKRINSWQELFDHWQKEADKYSALNRLRQYYDAERVRLTNPFHEELHQYIEANGPEAVTPEVMDRLYASVKPLVDDLASWYCRMVSEIQQQYRSE